MLLFFSVVVVADVGTWSSTSSIEADNVGILSYACTCVVSVIGFCVFVLLTVSMLYGSF